MLTLEKFEQALSVYFTDAKSRKGSRYTDCSIIIQLKQQDG